MPEPLLPVVINRSGGTAASLGARLADSLRECFAEAGRQIDLHLVDPSDVGDVLAKLEGQARVVIGGGDGTLGHAAGHLARTGTVMAILPLGTRNHLAGQLGIPPKLVDAAKVAVGGRTTRIDLGRAGDRVFVNNASLGLYSRLVRDRTAMRLPKWLANIPAALHVLRRLRSHPLALTIDDSPHHVTTPLLFIGNNHYSLEGGRVGTRQSLSDGELAFYAVAPKGPLALAAMGLRTLLGRADPERDFEALLVGRSARIAGGSMMDVACDGEVQRMHLPIEFSSWPAALEVVVP